MSKQNITLGFIKKRKADRLQEFKDGLMVGMLADEVLKFAEKKLIRRVRRPEKISENDFGYIVNWFYPGVILAMQREKKIGPYKVAEIDLGEVTENG
jgi:hypothetical protein